MFVLFWNSISRIISKSTLQNWWGNKNEVLSNILHKHIEWSFILIFIFNFHLKNMFTLKKPSRFVYLLMEKPGNWFSIVKKWRRMHLYLRVDSGTVFSFCLCANQATGFSVNGSSTPNGLFQTINGLLDTASTTVT